MSEDANVARVRELFAAFRERDIATIQAALAPDVVWHFPGRTGQLAGDHVGHDGVFTFLARVESLTGGTFSLDVEDILAGGDQVVIFFRGHGQRGGKELDNPTCLRVRLCDGQVAELWEFVWDLYSVDDFWT